MASIGSLTADLRLESAAFRRDLGKATQAINSQTAVMRRSMRAVEQQTRNVSRQFSQLRSAAAALAGVLAVRQFATFTRNAINSASAIQDVAQKVGLSTTALQQMRFAAEQSGVNIKTLDMAMQRFSRRLGEVAQGQGELLKTSQQYGVQLRDSSGRMRANVDVLKDFAEVIRNAESDQERLRIAFKLFDSEGAALVNTFREGRVGLERYMEQAIAFGAVMDERVIATAKIAGDSLAALQRVFSVSFDTAIIRGFAGEITASADAFQKAQQVGEQFGAAVGASMRAVVSAAKFVAENMREIQAALAALVAFKAATIFAGIAVAAWRLVSALQAATVAQRGLNLAMISNPIGLVAAAVATAVGAMVLYRDKTFQVGETTVQVGKVLVAAWTSVREAVMSVFEGAGNLGRALAQLGHGDLAEAWNQLQGGGKPSGFDKVLAAWADLGPDAAKAAKELADNSKELGGEIRKTLTPAQAELAKKIAETTKELHEQVGQLELQAKAVKRSETEYTTLVRKQSQWNEVAATGVKTGTEEERVLFDLVKRRDELTKAISDEIKAREANVEAAKREMERQREMAKERRALMVQPFLNAAEQIQRGFSDAFYSIFRGDKNRSLVDSFLDFVKDGFARLLAEMATLAIARPIIVPLVASVAGVMGLPASATSTLTTGLGGGAGGGGLFGGGIPNLPIGGLFNNATNAINIFGEGLGFGAGNVAAGGTLAGGAGPAGGFANTAAAAGQASGAFTSATLSSVLGGAGFGALAGGFASSLTGGSSLGGNIGGALGGAIGSMFGPIGTLAGGAIGGAIGGLFGGGGPSDMTQAVTVDLATGQVISAGGLSGKKFSAQNQQAAQQVAQEFAALAQSVGGVSKQLEVIVGSREGARFRINGGAVQSAGSDIGRLRQMIQASLAPDFTAAQQAQHEAQRAAQEAAQEAQRAAQEAAQAAAQAAQETAEKAALDERDRNQILQFIDNLQKPGAHEAIARVNAEFGKMITRATELGIATHELVAARDREIASIKAQFRAPFIQGASGIVSFLNAQSLSSNSATSPTQRLAEAQRQFGTLLGRVRGGEAGLAGSLTQSAGTLLDIGRQQFASSVDFAGLERFVRGSLLNVAERLTSDQFFDQQLAATRQQTAVFSDELGALRGVVTDLRNEFRFLRQELAA